MKNIKYKLRIRIAHLFHKPFATLGHLEKFGDKSQIFNVLQLIIWRQFVYKIKI